MSGFEKKDQKKQKVTEMVRHERLQKNLVLCLLAAAKAPFEVPPGSVPDVSTAHGCT